MLSRILTCRGLIGAGVAGVLFLSTGCDEPAISVSRNEKGIFIASAGTDERSYKEGRLSSGKTIKVVAIRKLIFAPGGDPAALSLLYQTDIPIDNVDELRSEALEIWTDFQHDVNRAGLSSALITAGEAPRGGTVWHRSTYAFPFKKDGAGRWRLIRP